jgi:2-dehydropantoate 2-reductase
VGGFGSSVCAPGHVHHEGWELVRLGEISGSITPRLEQIAEVWRLSGFRAKCFDNIDQLIWEKLICNVCFSGPCAVTEMTIGQVMEDSDAWTFAVGCAKEAFAVAKARSIRLNIDDPVKYVREFGEKIPHARPSMLLDHIAGKMSEIDFINGAIPIAAHGAGLEAPYNTVISALVRLKERKMGVRQ